jgi:hypothetical protein
MTRIPLLSYPIPHGLPFIAELPSPSGAALRLPPAAGDHARGGPSRRTSYGGGPFQLCTVELPAGKQAAKAPGRAGGGRTQRGWPTGWRCILVVARSYRWPQWGFFDSQVMQYSGELAAVPRRVGFSQTAFPALFCWGAVGGNRARSWTPTQQPPDYSSSGGKRPETSLGSGQKK